MRPFPALLLLLAVLPGGCAPALAVAGVEAASVAVFGRDVVDLGVSAVTGRDCSVVRLDRNETYCAARFQPPVPRFCTKTLGSVQCWADPAAFAVLPRSLEDTPAPTREQTRQAAAGWPRSLNLTD